MAITVLVINIGLWVDFITGVGRVRARDRTGWFTDLFKVSTNILLCLFILPYFLVKKGLCRYGDKTKFWRVKCFNSLFRLCKSKCGNPGTEPNQEMYQVQV